MKVSVVSLDLSLNCTNRAVTVARALRPHYEVEVVGAATGVDLWPPLEGTDIPIRSVPGRPLPGYVSTFLSLLSIMDGEVIIACKARMSSYGAALAKRRLSGTPVILDEDDDELAQTMPGRNLRLKSRLRHPNGYDTTRLVDRCRHSADAVFCVSEHLRAHYGGIIVPHGLPADAFDPAGWDRGAVRKSLGIDESAFVFGFIGSPQMQKGVDLLAHVLAATNDPRVKLMIVGGSPEDGFVADLCRQHGQMIKVLGMQPVSRLPELLAAVDAVALPQRPSPASLGQMPAKLTDAMAMGKPIIASALADIPKYLDGCGLLVEPGSFEDLLAKVTWVIGNREEAQAMGRRARERFLKDLTLEAMARLMVPEIERVRRKREAR